MTRTDTLLWIAGFSAECGVVGLLVWRRVFWTLPVFCAYLSWSLVSDLVQYTASYHLPASTNIQIYVIGLAIDSVFQFGVLFELARSVLRPIAPQLPRWTSIAVGVLILLVCAAIWPLANVPGYSGFHLSSQLMVHLQQTFAILRIFFFLILAGCSQLLSIGWRDRELQIATGLGFFSMISVSASVIHTHQATASPLYHLPDQFVSASYVCSLLYWAYCFVQQEAKRREFTPQMQNFLLAVAGTARSTRISLSDTNSRNGRDSRR